MVGMAGMATEYVAGMATEYAWLTWLAWLHGHVRCLRKEIYACASHINQNDD